MEHTNIYLASLATFKSFYDNKMDIYGIIGEFIKSILYKNQGINSGRVKELLYKEYYFYIPISVVEATLSKLTKGNKILKENKVFSLKDIDEIKRFSTIDISNDKFIELHDEVIESLILFIRDGGFDIEPDKEQLTKDFFKYIINPYEETYYRKYVVTYLSGNKLEEKIKSLIQQIKEGEILLSGLSYQIDPNEIEIYKLRKNLIIYIDQELLFSSHGYNGVFL